jgi:hypothetical protein
MACGAFKDVMWDTSVHSALFTEMPAPTSASGRYRGVGLKPTRWLTWGVELGDDADAAGPGVGHHLRDVLGGVDRGRAEGALARQLRQQRALVRERLQARGTNVACLLRSDPSLDGQAVLQF